MNIAIIIYGPLREFNIAKKSWGIFEKLNCDFYFSTWSKSKQKHIDFGMILEDEIDENHIKNSYPNAIIKIHDENQFIPCVEGEYNVNINKMIFHWKYGLKMIRESEKKYDILILLRPDLYIHYNKEPSTLYEFCNEKTLYGIKYITIDSIDKKTGEFNYFANDVFLMGSYDVVSKVIDNVKKDFGSSIHHRLGKTILDLGFYIDIIDSFLVVPVRPISRNLEDDEINYNRLMEDHIKYSKNYKI